VRLRDVRLIHDSADDRLALEDARGQRLVPLSLGAMLMHPMLGAVSLLAKIGTPYTVVSPGVIPPDDPAATFVRRPRRTSGRVVLARECWWVRSRWLADHVLARRG